MKLKLPYFLLAGMLLTGCSNNTLDDVEDVAQTDDDDGAELVVYADIQPIMSSNCVSCHANPPQNGAPMPLVSYQNVVQAVNNRDLLDRISRNAGESGLMPPGGPRLPQNAINLMNQWEEDGLLEE